MTVAKPIQYQGFGRLLVTCTQCSQACISDRPGAAQVAFQPTGIEQDWELFDVHCKLRPLADQLLSASPIEKASRVPILFLGDSIDRYIHQDVCDLGSMLGARTDPIGFDNDQVTLRVSLRRRRFWCISVMLVHLVQPRLQCNKAWGC